MGLCTAQSGKRAVISIGFSPCPNDTYIFNGLVHGHVGIDGVDLQPEVLADVETLNEWALEGRLDVSKLSFSALGHVTADYVLPMAGTLEQPVLQTNAGVANIAYGGAAALLLDEDGTY